MSWTKADSENASQALELVEGLQTRMVDNLTAMSERVGATDSFAPVSWLRDQGRHGGGVRYVAVDSPMFNRASVNVSEIQYDDMPEKRLASATALSTIIHPQHPLAPSFHMHISWTEMRNGSGYWRVMADLNPSIPCAADTAAFQNALRQVAPESYNRAVADGERYFFIPALKRHRGVAHYYLEGYTTNDFAADKLFARTLGQTAADTYAGIVEQALDGAATPTEDERREQLAYHTLYLLQVLTLDRGTTSGLLVHDQNDVGILGSLPARIDPELLSSWIGLLPAPQDALLAELVSSIPDTTPSQIDDVTRARLAGVVRQHYRANPHALALQASGSIVPPTVANHSPTTD